MKILNKQRKKREESEHLKISTIIFCIRDLGIVLMFWYPISLSITEVSVVPRHKPC